MIRAGAQGKYFFPQTFFSDSINLLKNHIEVESVFYKGIVIAIALYLKHGTLVYYWLSVSKREFRKCYPNVFMIHQAMLRFKKEGYKYLVLGGGISENDSLFQFKSHFSNYIKEFFVYQKIHLEKEYIDLIDLEGKAIDISEDFFPVYRQH